MSINRFIFYSLSALWLASSSAAAAPVKTGELDWRGSGYSAAEKAAVIRAYETAARENLYPRSVHNLISEGISKRVRAQDMLEAVDRRINRLREIRSFCANTRPRPLAFEETDRNADALLLALGGNVSWEEIKAAYAIAEESKFSPDDYRELVRMQFGLKRRQVPGAYVARLLEAARQKHMPFRYVRKLMKMVEENPDEASRESMLDAMNENMSLFEIERVIERRRGYGPRGVSGGMQGRAGNSGDIHPGFRTGSDGTSPSVSGGEGGVRAGEGRRGEKGYR